MGMAGMMSRAGQVHWTLGRMWKGYIATEVRWTWIN